MKTNRLAVSVLVLVFAVGLTGCAAVILPPKVESTTTLTKDLNGQVLSTSYERKVSGRSYRDPETALSVAEADLLLSYGSGQTTAGKNTATKEKEGLGFIVNDRYIKWTVTIQTKSGIKIFQTDMPRRAKLAHKLRWGTYVAVWSNGRETFTKELRVMPYTEVATRLKETDQEDTVGHWMTQLPE